MHVLYMKLDKMVGIMIILSTNPNLMSDVGGGTRISIIRCLQGF